MQQIIGRNSDCSISSKSYVNDRGQLYGLSTSYWLNGNIWYVINWFNGKKYGLQTWYHKNGKNKGKIEQQRYFL